MTLLCAPCLLFSCGLLFLVIDLVFGMIWFIWLLYSAAGLYLLGCYLRCVCGVLLIALVVFLCLGGVGTMCLDFVVVGLIDYY